MFSFSLLIRKSLSHSERFEMGESKHKRKVFLHLGIWVGHWGRGVQPIEPKSCIPNYWGQLSGVNLQHVAILHDQLGFSMLLFSMTLLLATPLPKKILPLYPFSLQWNYKCYFLAQIPFLFWSHTQTSSLSNGPRTHASLLLSSKFGEHWACLGRNKVSDVALLFSTFGD